LDELPEGSKGFTIGLTIYIRFRRVNCSEWHCNGRRVRKKQWAFGHVNLYLSLGLILLGSTHPMMS